MVSLTSLPSLTSPNSPPSPTSAISTTSTTPTTSPTHTTSLNGTLSDRFAIDSDRFKVAYECAQARRAINNTNIELQRHLHHETAISVANFCWSADQVYVKLKELVEVNRSTFTALGGLFDRIDGTGREFREQLDSTVDLTYDLTELEAAQQRFANLRAELMNAFSTASRAANHSSRDAEKAANIEEIEVSMATERSLLTLAEENAAEENAAEKEDIEMATQRILLAEEAEEMAAEIEEMEVSMATERSLQGNVGFIKSDEGRQLFSSFTEAVHKYELMITSIVEHQKHMLITTRKVGDPSMDKLYNGIKIYFLREILSLASIAYALRTGDKDFETRYTMFFTTEDYKNVYRYETFITLNVNQSPRQLAVDEKRNENQRMTARDENEVMKARQKLGERIIFLLVGFCCFSVLQGISSLVEVVRDRLTSLLFSLF
eukprot:GHVN01081877.1.p1 GENE.GHVN01081877.1~~GHVN01081877.1.p1  ORF type:complete len:434 (+),score=104.42 GHVN01081877.1:51-1352(+)